MPSLQDALALRDAGRTDEALRELERICAVEPEITVKAHCLLNQAAILVARGDLLEAQSRLTSARALNPGDEESHVMIRFVEGCLSFAEGRFEEAMHVFEAILANYGERLANPENKSIFEDVQIRLANATVAAGDTRGAIELLERVVRYEVPPEQKSDLLCHLGTSYLQLKDYEKSKHAFESAFELGIPEKWRAYAPFYLGMCYCSTGEYLSAVKMLEIAQPIVVDSGHASNLARWLSYAKAKAKQSSAQPTRQEERVPRPKA